MRSLSNLIKSRYVYVNDENRKIIDSNGKSEELRTIYLNRRPEQLPGDTKASKEDSSDSEDIVFREGLQVSVIDNVLPEEEEKQQRMQGEQIIADAREEADRIRKQAEEEAGIAAQEILEEARKKGYEDGLQKGMAEADRAKAELEELKQKHNEEYLEQIAGLEPAFGEIVAQLVEKLTGVAVEDKKNVILYLIHNSIMDSNNSKSYAIRVSKEDYDYVLSRKEELYRLVTQDTVIDIISDKNLERNQCLIETDAGMLDCSLDVELANLIQDIKLLSKQKS